MSQLALRLKLLVAGAVLIGVGLFAIRQPYMTNFGKPHVPGSGDSAGTPSAYWGTLLIPVLGGGCLLFASLPREMLKRVMDAMNAPPGDAPSGDGKKPPEPKA